MITSIIVILITSMNFVDKVHYRTLMQVFHRGLTGAKSWYPVMMPFRADGGRVHCNIAALDSLLLIQIEPSAAMTRQIWSPVPISGVVIPIFNLPHPDYDFLDSNFQRAVEDTILRAYWTYQCPILVTILQASNQPPLGDTSNPLWWIADSHDSEFWATAVAAATVNTVQTSDPAMLPGLLTDYFHLPMWQSNTSSMVRLPLLPQVEVHPSHLGTRRRASVGFVRDFARYALPLNIPLRVWFDVAIPPFTVRTREPLKYWEPRIRQNDLLYTDEMSGETLLLSEPSLYKSQDGQYMSDPAFHAYIELEGYVCDSVVAFQTPKPVEQFQASLKPVHREHLEIPPGMTPQQAVKLIDEQLDSVMEMANT